MRIYHMVLRHTERGYIEAAVAADSTAAALGVFEDVYPCYDDAGTTLSIECAAEVFAHSEFMSAAKCLALDTSEWGGAITAPDDEEMPEENRERMLHLRQEAISELAESMREQGLLQPIVVWQPEEGQYTIVCGERRYRAAQQLGWDTIPALVRRYESAEAAQIDRVIENLQRENLPPLIEAEGMAQLRERGFSAEDIARKVGLSTSAIYCRLRLHNLSPRWREALADPENDYAYFAERLSWLEEVAALPHDPQDYILTGHHLRGVQNIRRVREIIEQELRLIIDAPFDDAQFPKKERCAGCLHRTDAGGLFPELAQGREARCCRPECWERKCRAGLELALDRLLKDGEECILQSTEAYYREAVLERVPERLRAAVEEWPIRRAQETSYESAEQARAQGYGEPVEARIVFVDGPQIGRVVAVWLRGERLGEDCAPASTPRPEPEPTPLMLAAREIQARFMPEGAVPPDGSVCDLLRLLAFFCNDICPEGEADLDECARTIAAWGEGMGSVKEAAWRMVWDAACDVVGAMADSRWYNGPERREELALVFEWLGIAEAGQLLPESESEEE